ncbi:MAG: class I SAM-dependent rRNA methyltransferase [Bacteroidales bacterium]
MARIYLKKGREDSLKRFHPWIFSGAIESTDKSNKDGDHRNGDLAEGDLVEVCSNSGEFFCMGHFQIGSIAIRILSFDKSASEKDFWFERLNEARKLRTNTICTTDCYRLVHGEGDMLPGLIIDFYNGVAVIQCHSAGMFLNRDAIADALKRLYGSDLKAIYDKSSATAPFKAGLELNDSYLYKSDGFNAQNHIVTENGIQFAVDWEGGQKTGFFLDQRENRELVKRYSAGKRVLNLFCYTGGFSLYALRGGAVSVDSVDSSSKAMESLEKNLLINNFPGIEQGGQIDNSQTHNSQTHNSQTHNSQTHNSYCTDAIEFIKSCAEGSYDLIIVDPPAFAKHRGALSNALRAYQRLNYAAINAVAPGGIIFTYSCSQVVDKISFAQAVFSAAAQTGRKVRIIGRLTQPADHPVNIYHPEGEYLKGLVLFVE